MWQRDDTIDPGTDNIAYPGAYCDYSRPTANQSCDAHERRKRLKAQGDCCPRRKYKLSIDGGQTWNHVKSMHKAADYLKEFQRPVSVTRLWWHLHQDRGDNVGSLPLNVLFEKVGDDTEQ